MNGTQTGVRIERVARGEARAATGLPVLDHLLGELAKTARLRITLEVEPGTADEEVAAAGRALGTALAESLAAPGSWGRGWAIGSSSPTRSARRLGIIYFLRTFLFRCRRAGLLG